MIARHPFKQQARDERAHGIIGHYIEKHGVDSGHEYPVTFSSHDAANEGRLCVRRGSRHHGVHCSAWVTDCEDGTAVMTFQLWSADRARRHVLQQSAGRPENLKYNPYASGAGRSYERRGC